MRGLLSTCGSNLGFLLRSAPFLLFTETCNHEDVSVVQNKSFLTGCFHMKSVLFSSHQREDLPNEGSVFSSGWFCMDVTSWGVDGKVHISVNFAAWGSDLFVWLPGIKWKPQHSLTIIPQLWMSSLWPCTNSFAESINSRAWTCSHKYTTQCPAFRESSLCFLLSHKQTHTFLCANTSWHTHKHAKLLHFHVMSWINCATPPPLIHTM